MRKIDIIYIGAIIILVIILFKSCDGNRSQTALYEASQAELETTVNELGQQTATIDALQAGSAKDLLSMETKDSTIMRLQEVVDGFEGNISSATVVSSESFDVGTTASTIIRVDTFYTDTGMVVFQVYKSAWDEKWSIGSIIASKDSISRSIKIKNEFDITVGWADKGWLKKDEFEVAILNKNPNTVVTELQTFKVEPPKKRWSVGPAVGYGVLINKNGISSGWIAGGTISYTIFSF